MKSDYKGIIAQSWQSVGIFVCAFLFLMLTMARGINVYDEGLILFGSVRLLSGDVPYRDFYANYGPAQFYVVAALFKVFGPSVIIERIWDLLIRSSTILIVYLIIDSAWDRMTASFTALVTMLWLSTLGFYGYPIFPCIFFSLLSLYLILHALSERKESTFLFAGGVSIGVVSLFRYDVGVLAAIAGLLSLVLYHLMQIHDVEHKKKVLVRSTMTYVCGITIAVVPVLSLFLTAVDLQDILRNLVYLPAPTYVRFRSLPFPSIAEFLNGGIENAGTMVNLIVYLPVLGVLVGAVAVSSLNASRLHTDLISQGGLISRRRWILIHLSAFSVFFFLKGIVRVSPLHMALSIIPSIMIVFATISQWRQLRYKVSLVMLGLAFACLYISSIPAVGYTWAKLYENVAWAAGNESSERRDVDEPSLRLINPNSCFPPDGLERIRCFQLDRNRIDAILYIQQKTKDGEYIYVGTNRHDKILANDILFYFASKRLSATKWHHFDPGIHTTTEVQSEIIYDLKIRVPRYIVLSSEWDDVQEPNDSAMSSEVTLLDDFLKANYVLVVSFGRLNIYQITTDLSPNPH